MNEPSQTRLSPGQKVGLGRYTLVRKLGAGGMGVVWLAQDDHLREDVALKFLPPQVQEDKQALEGLRRETARAHKLNHPNIVRIHDFHSPPGETAFISMEYIQGKTMGELRHEQPGGVFAWTTLAPLVKQLCEALDYAHGEGVIHRDLKPHNVMVDAKGRVRLADFGIAAVVSDSLSRVSLQHASSGTPAYMSPQQMNGKKPRVADDVYSLGATVYHLLTSQPPFYQGVIAHQVMNTLPDPIPERLRELELQNDVPPEVGTVVLACLAKEPEQRPQSPAEVWTWLNSPEARFSCTAADTIPVPEVTSAATRAEVLPTSPQQKPAVEATVADTPTATPAVVGRAVPSAPGQPDAFKEHPDTNRLLTPQDASKERLAGDSEPYPPPGSSKPKPKSGLWLALAACLLLGGVGAWYFLKYQPEQERQRQVAAQQAQDAAEKKRLTDEAETKRLAEEKIKQEAEAKRLAEAKAQQDEARRKEAERIAAARGGLIVDTKPSGATATLGGEHIEKTPATFKGGKLGKFPLKLLLSGYEEVQREVEIKENEFLDLGTLTLMRSTGQLKIHSQPDAMDWQLKSDTGEITERQGKTPSSLTNLPTGTYRVTLLRPGWPEYKGEAAIARNQATTVQHEFAQGGLMVTSDPKGAEAELEGKSIGKTPVAVTVPVGEHELTVRYPRFATQKQTVKVTKDTTNTVSMQFPYGSVSITSEPSGAMVKNSGSTVGTTPLTLDLVAVGEVNYQVELSSYRNKGVQGTVQAGQSTRLTVKLVKARPQLSERWTNSLGMAFAPVPGTKVLFGIWETRAQDFSAFAQDRANNANWNYQSGAEPYIFKSREHKQRGWEYGWNKPGFAQAPDHPVTCVSWEDAQAFCQWLTKRDQAAGLLEKNQQYRLPTDMEWSQAVGLPDEGNGFPTDKNEKIKDFYPWGTQWPPPEGAGNYDSSLEVDSFEYTSPVGSFAADKNGLFDLDGNVMEWCEDWYDTDQESRVLRGGSWGARESMGLWSSCRFKCPLEDRVDCLGFRVVLVVGGSVQTTPKPASTIKVNVPQNTNPNVTKEVTLSSLSKVSGFTKDHPWTNSLGMKFVPVPGTDVLFSIWETRVKDYQTYAKASGQSVENPGFVHVQGATHPAVRVSWDDAKAFCQWLTEQECKAGKITVEQSYRLPTDEEWSTAVGLPRESGNTPKDKDGGIKDVYPWGTQWPPPKGAGNYDSSLKVDSFEDTAPVGSFAANKNGLFDLDGNVMEWCEDLYDTDQKYRVLRGGSHCGGDSRRLLSSDRNGDVPEFRSNRGGFRVVLVVGGSVR